jgi:signal peptidase II
LERAVKTRVASVSGLGWVALSTAAAVVALDQASKAWILYGLQMENLASRPVLAPYFRLSLEFNDGMSFSLLHAAGAPGRWFLTVFALAVAGGLAWWARATERPWFALGAGLLIGGSLGNVIDRLRLGAVVDFVDFTGLNFPYIFNLADSGVTVGATLLLVEAFWPSVKTGLPRWRDRLRMVLASLRVRGN